MLRDKSVQGPYTGTRKHYWEETKEDLNKQRAVPYDQLADSILSRHQFFPH